MQKSIVQVMQVQTGGPVLDMVWSAAGDSLLVATGALQNNILFVNLAGQTQTPTPIGTHDGITGLVKVQMNGIDLLLTVGANKQLNVWMNQGSWAQKMSINLPKVPSCIDADITSNLVAMGLEGELGIYNLNGLQSGNT